MFKHLIWEPIYGLSVLFIVKSVKFLVVNRNRFLSLSICALFHKNNKCTYAQLWQFRQQHIIVSWRKEYKLLMNSWNNHFTALWPFFSSVNQSYLWSLGSSGYDSLNLSILSKISILLELCKMNFIIHLTYLVFY